MASAADRRRSPATHAFQFFHSASTNISSFLNSKQPSPPPPASKFHLPLLLQDSVLSLTSPSDSAQSDSSFSSSQSSATSPSTSSSIKSTPSAETRSGFPSTVRISTGKGGGPAFVGQVFSMCDLSGTGLMAVSTRFDIPFLSKRTPEWLKKMFSTINGSKRNGPVFRFFMDLGDAVSYVKQLNIPSGVVGACRLDTAYEHFKDKPDLFQFVPNERQVKEANKLLKTLPRNDGRKKVEGVPVFGAENLDIAVATNEGLKWYTPYFFDKNMLDNILEESMDQHFHSLIETRNYQRRQDLVVDDSLTAEALEEMESMGEPSELQDVLDEMGHQETIPLAFSVMSKAAEIELMYAVDKVLLGNKWLRKATGIQPKFPYMVDSFEKKSAVSFLRAKNPSRDISNSGFGEDAQLQRPDTSNMERKDNNHDKQGQMQNFQFPFGDWFSHPWSEQQENQQNPLDTREGNSTGQDRRKNIQSSLLLPKITMFGIATSDPGNMSKSTLVKTIESLTKKLEKAVQVSQIGSNSSNNMVDERDPLFVANVGDYQSTASKTGSVRWIRGG